MAPDPETFAPQGPWCLTETGIRKVLIDILGGIITTTRNHREIHEGEFFTFGFTFLDVADDAFAYLRFLTGAKNFHFGNDVVAEGKARAFLYRSTTFTAPGTAVPVVNNNCASSNTALLTAFSNPTPNVLGTLLTPANGILLPGGLGPQSVGLQVKSDEERVAGLNTEYLVAVKNVSGLAKDITITLAGYEELIP